MQFTVVTEFTISENNTAGTVIPIRLLYVQDGQVIQTRMGQVSSSFGGDDSITTARDFIATVLIGLPTIGGMRSSWEKREN